MTKRIILLIAIIITITFLTSCWSQREIDSLGIVMAMGIDKSEEEYLITVQVLNTVQIASKQVNISPVITRRTRGRTIFEAIRSFTDETSRKLNFSHIRLLVLGEKLAEDGITKILDLFFRDPEVNSDFYILVAQGVSSTDILNVLTPIDSIPAESAFNSLELSEKYNGTAKKVQLDELINNILSDGKDPVLTGIYIGGQSHIEITLDELHKPQLSALLKIGNLAVFKMDQLVGWLNEKESQGYNYIMGIASNVQETTELYENERTTVTIELFTVNSSIKAKKKNGKPVIHVSVEATGNVGELQSSLDISKEENLDIIEYFVEESMKEKIELCIEKAKFYRCDIFGFGEVIHRAYPDIWKTLKESWDMSFINVPVIIDVNLEIHGTGTMINSYLKELRE